MSSARTQRDERRAGESRRAWPKTAWQDEVGEVSRGSGSAGFGSAAARESPLRFIVRKVIAEAQVTHAVQSCGKILYIPAG